MTPAEQTAYARGLRDAAAMLEVDRQTIRLHAGELSPREMLAKADKSRATAI